MTTVHDFSVAATDGSPVSLKSFAGRVLLIVNTASRCHFTPQYAGLQALHEKYRTQGFAVLAFPCNQFGAQEPGSSADIAIFCAAQYAVEFPVFAKIDVNGPAADPLFQFLTASRPGLLGTRRIKWNFTKFLISREGVPLARYAPRCDPSALYGAIEKALG